MADSLVEQPTAADLVREEIRRDEVGNIWSEKGNTIFARHLQDRWIVYNNLVTSSGLTEAEIASNSMLFLFAGYETTSATMSFVMYCLTTNPECQEKVIQEVDSVIGRRVRYFTSNKRQVV